MNDNKQITGRDIFALKDSYTYLELQYLLGMSIPKISSAVTPKNIDKPIHDSNRCLLIRFLQRTPRNSKHIPLPEEYHFTNLTEITEDLSLPFPFEPNYFGILLGKTSTTAKRLAEGHTEVQSVTRACTIIRHLSAMEQVNGIDPWMRCIELEARSRGVTLDQVIAKKGWKKNTDFSSNDCPRVTGQSVEVLKQSFHFTELQYLLGLYTPKLYELTLPANIDKPVNDVTLCLLMRFLQEYPELVPMPKCWRYEDVVENMPNYGLPVTGKEFAGVLIGRNPGTLRRLNQGETQVQGVLRACTIIQSLYLDKSVKDIDPWIDCIQDEVRSRGTDLFTLLKERAWPGIEED